MAKITKEELAKLAQLSKLKLYEHEIESLSQQIQDVLAYAARVTKIATTEQITTEDQKKCNVYRSDISRDCEPEKILELAPERDNNYFVVPKIIESK